MSTATERSTTPTDDQRTGDSDEDITATDAPPAAAIAGAAPTTAPDAAAHAAAALVATAIAQDATAAAPTEAGSTTATDAEPAIDPAGLQATVDGTLPTEASSTTADADPLAPAADPAPTGGATTTPEPADPLTAAPDPESTGGAGTTTGDGSGTGDGSDLGADQPTADIAVQAPDAAPEPEPLTAPRAERPTTRAAANAPTEASASVPTADPAAAATQLASARSAATTAPAPTPPPPTPLPSAMEQVLRTEQLAESLRASFRRGETSSNLSIELHPAELGSVRVEARVVDGVTHLVLRAESAVAIDRLGSAMDQLRQDLARDGVDVGDLQLRQDGAGRQDGTGDDARGGGTGSTRAGTHATGGPGGPDQRPTPARHPGGSLALDL